MAKDSRTRYLTETLQAHDKRLYAERMPDGSIHVFRENSYVPLGFKPSPHFVVALTEDWTLDGRPVEWGALPLIDKIKSIDTWNKGFTADDLIERYKRAYDSQDKQRKNMTEDFFRDARGAFKKDFSEINTSNMDVKEESKKKGI